MARSRGLIIKAIGIDNARVFYVMLNLSRSTMIKNAIKFEFSGEERFFIEKNYMHAPAIIRLTQ